MPRAATALSTILCAVCLAAPALAGPVVPPAFWAFCAHFSQECRPTGPSVASVVLTAEKRAELESVNQSVNASLKEVADPEDEWTLSYTSGDCEEFAIRKRHDLIAKGWPSSVLSLTTARIEDGRGHLVLTVRTSEGGDLVLDNRRGAVMTTAGSGYRFFFRQSTQSPRVWESM